MITHCGQLVHVGDEVLQGISDDNGASTSIDFIGCGILNRVTCQLTVQNNVLPRNTWVRHGVMWNPVMTWDGSTKTELASFTPWDVEMSSVTTWNSSPCDMTALSSNLNRSRILVLSAIQPIASTAPRQQSMRGGFGCVGGTMLHECIPERVPSRVSCLPRHANNTAHRDEQHEEV
ncbi:hypothetical protein DM02DRAFT_625958 [Periconia macrospinosa]|uniref:Uncharacterized protein n=1 Tax=Periconia macrospinosa TaxID=97972 RepID=A0A2V1DZD8_9PLEO|nr:hypothetical protein DM02DRAFT_625958 [Periconia macrospinosa]